MKLAIMQPYFFPYIGYFQLLNAVDEFVIYDNIEFTKKGWINRNRILVNGNDAFITLPLKKDSDFLHVRDRYLADSWDLERKKMLNKLGESYRKAPHFAAVFPLIERCILFDDRNLFSLILNSIKEIMNYLDIHSTITISSSISIDHSLKSAEKVISICKHQKSDTYINPIGGRTLYDPGLFKMHKIDLRFLESDLVEYKQYNNQFQPWLSIIDVMMFNPINTLQEMVKTKYTLSN
jgi:hypothetical protein